MIVKDVVLHYEREDVFHLYFPSDAHGGTSYCAETEFENQMNTIARDPLGIYLDGGDKGEFITPSDPRWDYSGVADWVHPDNISHDQENWYMSVTEKAANSKMPHDDQSKCLGLLMGNHELKMRQKGHADVHNNICKGLNVSNLGYSCFLRLHFRYAYGKDARTVVCVFKHGSGNATTTSGKLTKLLHFMDKFSSSDIVGMGHMHEIVTHSPTHLDVNKAGRIVERNRCGAITGCYFCTYTQTEEPSYGEVQGFDPTKLGCAVFKITPRTGQIRVQEGYV